MCCHPQQNKSGLFSCPAILSFFYITKITKSFCLSFRTTFVLITKLKKNCTSPSTAMPMRTYRAAGQAKMSKSQTSAGNQECLNDQEWSTFVFMSILKSDICQMSSVKCQMFMLILETCWTTFDFMSMLKSPCLLFINKTGHAFYTSTTSPNPVSLEFIELVPSVPLNLRK